MTGADYTVKRACGCAVFVVANGTERAELCQTHSRVYVDPGEVALAVRCQTLLLDAHDAVERGELERAYALAFSTLANLRALRDARTPSAEREPGGAA